MDLSKCQMKALALIPLMSRTYAPFKGLWFIISSWQHKSSESFWLKQKLHLNFSTVSLCWAILVVSVITQHWTHIETILTSEQNIQTACLTLSCIELMLHILDLYLCFTARGHRWVWMQRTAPTTSYGWNPKISLPHSRVRPDFGDLTLCLCKMWGGKVK